MSTSEFACRGRRRLSRLRLAAAGSAVVMALGTATTAAAATMLADGFESGSATGWSKTSNIAVGTSYARTGSNGARAVTTSQTSGYLTWDSTRVTQSQRYGRIGGWVRIASCACAQNVGVLNVKNAHGSNHFDLWREGSTGLFRYDLYRGNSGWSTMPATVGQWYFIEVLIDFGGAGGRAYTAKVRINGTAQPAITSTAQVGTTVRSAWFGGPTTGLTNTRHYDDLALAVANTPLSFTR